MKSCALVILFSLLITQVLHLAVGDSANCPYVDFATPEGIFEIQLNGSQPFAVPCNGDGFMSILNRTDGSENFDRNWTDYKEGFGKLWGEFFLGLEKLHLLTKAEPHILYILLWDVNNNIGFARYDGFQIGSEEESYYLKSLGQYSGTAGDSLRIHRDMKFSTFDRDNDRSKNNCAKRFGGGWWYKDCGYSALSGKNSSVANTDVNGILWETWKKEIYNHDSIREVTMSIIRKSQYVQIESDIELL